MTLSTFQTSVTLSITTSGAGIKTFSFTPAVFPLTNNAAPCCGAVTVALVTGNNDSIPVPPGAMYYIILADPTSTNAKIVSNTPASFAGITFTGQPMLLPVNNQSMLYIYSNAAEAVQIVWL